MQTQTANIVTTFLDFIESVLLTLIFAISAPVLFLRQLRRSESMALGRALLPYGVWSIAVQAKIDFCLQNYGRALSGFESAIATLEESTLKVQQKFPKPTQRCLEILYTHLIRTYLCLGQVDDAAYCMIRGNQSLGVHRFLGLRAFDHKIAQMVRAGVAATKLMEQGGGIATFMLQPAKAPKKTSSVPPQKNHGKIIPFRRPTPLH